MFKFKILDKLGTKKKGSKAVNNALPIGYVLRGGRYDYRIEEVLGQGNYGITYKVSASIPVGNIVVEQLFAVKENFGQKYCSRLSDGVTMTYPSGFAKDAKGDLNDFIAEGRLLERLCKGHRNIVNVNETFRANNTAYYTMEYLDGGDLCSLVKAKGGGYAEREAVKLLHPIIDAVGYVHKQRYAHYDIKPENIVIRKGKKGSSDEPVLIDFGIAQHYTNDGKLTKTSKDKGTGCSDGYAPIEQYAGITEFSPQCDVYALAATLFYIQVGKNPLIASNISAKWIEANLPNSTSQQTRQAIKHAMERDAVNRTGSVSSFLWELKMDMNPTKEEADEKMNPNLTKKKVVPSSSFPLRKYLVRFAFILFVGYATYSLFNSIGYSKSENPTEQADSVGVNQETDTTQEIQENQDKQVEREEKNQKQQNPEVNNVAQKDDNKEKKTNTGQQSPHEPVVKMSAAEMARLYMNKFKSGERISENLSKAFEYAKQADEAAKEDIINELIDVGYRPALMYKKNKGYETER